MILGIKDWQSTRCQEALMIVVDLSSLNTKFFLTDLQEFDGLWSRT